MNKIELIIKDYENAKLFWITIFMLICPFALHLCLNVNIHSYAFSCGAIMFLFITFVCIRVLFL